MLAVQRNRLLEVQETFKTMMFYVLLNLIRIFLDIEI